MDGSFLLLFLLSTSQIFFKSEHCLALIIVKLIFKLLPIWFIVNRQLINLNIVKNVNYVLYLNCYLLDNEIGKSSNESTDFVVDRFCVWWFCCRQILLSMILCSTILLSTDFVVDDFMQLIQGSDGSAKTAKILKIKFWIVCCGFPASKKYFLKKGLLIVSFSSDLIMKGLGIAKEIPYNV